MAFNFKKVATESFGVLQKVMPWVGAVAASVASDNPTPLFAQVADSLSKTTGKSVDPTPASINAAVQGATPDQLLQAKQIDDDFAAKMKAMGFQNAQQLAQIAAQDRASARQMQTATRSLLPGALAIVTTIGFFGTLIAVLHYGISSNPANHDIELILITTLQAGWLACINFYLGSSQGSSDKNSILAQAVQQK